MKRLSAVLAVLACVSGCASTAPREAASVRTSLVFTSSSMGASAEATGTSTPDSSDNTHTEATKPLYAPRPEYPEPERLAGVEANVVVHYRVTEDGRVTHARAFGPAAFRAAALTALGSWRFKPQTRDGAGLPSVRATEFKFRVRA